MICMFINIDYLAATRFSSSGDMLVVAGLDRWLKVFKIDNETNEKLIGGVLDTNISLVLSFTLVLK
jgi:hypothetical protein